MRLPNGQEVEYAVKEATDERQAIDIALRRAAAKGLVKARAVEVLEGLLTPAKLPPLKS